MTTLRIETKNRTKSGLGADGQCKDVLFCIAPPRVVTGHGWCISVFCGRMGAMICLEEAEAVSMIERGLIEIEGWSVHPEGYSLVPEAAASPTDCYDCGETLRENGDCPQCSHFAGRQAEMEN